jgi:hypothetical protein
MSFAYTRGVSKVDYNPTASQSPAPVDLPYPPFLHSSVFICIHPWFQKPESKLDTLPLAT